MIRDEYPEGEVFCPICQKKLISEDDKERGYHYHCEKSEVFCKDFDVDLADNLEDSSIAYHNIKNKDKVK